MKQLKGRLCLKRRSARELPGCFSAWVWLAIAVLALITPFCAQAQIGATATIQGTVTDPSGAVIPGALVSVTNLGTGAQISQKTTNSGFYSISPLDIGSYSLSVSAPDLDLQ